MTNGAYALHAGYLWLQTHTHIHNTYCFSTATMVARTCLNAKLYSHCLSCLNIVLCSVPYAVEAAYYDHFGSCAF
jgi:hypothetical protein